MVAEAWDLDDLPPPDEAQPIVPISVPALADSSGNRAHSRNTRGRNGRAREASLATWQGRASFLRRLSPFLYHAVPPLAKALVELDAASVCLDLSELDFTDGQVPQLLSDPSSRVPSLNRLVLIGCPSISEPGLYTFLSTSPRLFCELDVFLHPLTPSVRDPPVFPATFMYLASFDRAGPAIRGTVFTPARLLQNLLNIFVAAKRACTQNYSWDSGIATQSVFSGMRQPGQRWAERSVVSVPVVGLDMLTGDRKGWMCLYKNFDADISVLDRWCSRGPSRFAFIRRKHSETCVCVVGTEARTSRGSSAQGLQWTSAFEILDMRGLVDALVAEGRPAPPEVLVAQLADLLASKLKEEKTEQGLAKKDLSGSVESHSVAEFRLMEEANILQFMEAAQRCKYDEFIGLS